MSDIRVLHISSAITWRGGENQILLLLQGLKNQGAENHLLCPDNSILSKRVTSDLADVHRFKKRTGIGVLVAFRIRKLVLERKVQIIHVHDAHAHTFSLIASLLGMKVPIIVTRRVDFRIKKRSLWKYNHPSVSNVIGVSKAIVKVLEYSGVNKNKLDHIYSGIDLSLAQPKAISSTKHTTTIAFLGAMVTHKDPLTFVKMANEIIAQRADIKFKMIGHFGEMSTQVLLEIKRLNLESKIEILDFQSDLTPVWQNIDLLAVTSKEEGLNTTILEAFARNIPVIATAAGGITELVIHNKTGRISPIGDHCHLAENALQIINNNELAQQLTLEAFNEVKKYRFTGMSDSYFKLYNRIVN